MSREGLEKIGYYGEGEGEKEGKEEVDCWYFCGNSLGLQPKGTKEVLMEELEVCVCWDGGVGTIHLFPFFKINFFFFRLGRSLELKLISPVPTRTAHG